VALLGGYPLSLTVVLPVLAAAAPSAVLAELKAGGRGADPAGLIGRAIEYSHGQLDPALQNSLLLLAPFTSVIGTGRMLERYRDRLLEQEAVRALGSVDLAAALDQAVSVGLATPHPQHGDLVQVQPVLPYFLRSRLHHQPTRQAAASQAHYLLYRDLVGELADMLHAPEDPRPRLAAQGAIRAEYANLATALDYGLRTGQPVEALIDALDTYLRQSRQHETRRQLLDDAIAAYLEPTGPDGQIGLAFLHEFAGGAALGQHQLDVAEGHFKTAIGLLEAAGNRKRQSALYHQLARIAHDQKHYDRVETSYRKAREIRRVSDRRAASSIAARLGAVLAELGQHHEAVRILTHVAVVWHQETGQWAEGSCTGCTGNVPSSGPANSPACSRRICPPPSPGTSSQRSRPTAPSPPMARTVR
jgi:hypothetical protein